MSGPILGKKQLYQCNIKLMLFFFFYSFTYTISTISWSLFMAFFLVFRGICKLFRNFLLQEFQSLLDPQCFFSVVQAKSATERALMFNYNFCHFSQFIVYNVFIDVLWGEGSLLCSYFWFITDWLWINKFAILQSSKVNDQPNN